MALMTGGLVGCERQPSAGTGNPPEEFIRLMNAGKNYLERGDTTNAVAIYRKAETIVPHDADVHLNLANGYLAGGATADAIREADEVLKLEPNSAAAYFIKGSAYLRISNAEEAAKALENAFKIDPGEKATLFQLGRARMGLQQWEAAITAFKEGLAMDPNRLHAGPRYLMAQALMRAGRQGEADKELQLHQGSADGGTVNAGTFERSKFTLARVPFKLEQPEKEGIKVRFVDATKETFGDGANLSGPVGVIDPNRSGWNSLFVRGQGSFRLLRNSNGVFRVDGADYPVRMGGNFSKVLVGDLQNDRVNDVVVLGDKGGQVFLFDTNGTARDVTAASGIDGLGARDGMLMDLDFTGKLDLVAVTGSSNEVRIFRQFGPVTFKDVTSTSAVPGTVVNVRGVMMDDWNRDGIMDVIASRDQGPALLLEKQRGGPLTTREPTNWVTGAAFCTGDFDNDLRPDLAVVSDGKIVVCFNGGGQAVFAGSGRKLVAVDHDNDGWLDLWALGDKIRVWRNRGLAGFQERTDELGLHEFGSGEVSEIHFADFDNDCDSDVIVALAEGGLRYLRNEGGNANGQIKVNLVGTRSNASGIGCKVEVETGGLRLMRTVQQLPVEVGVGKYRKLDSFLVHWFNWPQGSAEVPFNCKEPLFALELSIQEGSCPYLYAWDGNRFRFVTDILGAAPLGLPVAEGRYVEADPEEFVWIGSEETFPSREGAYEVRITEELREVLYLDEAKLVVVDREVGTEVHSTDKLLPSGPFVRGGIVNLQNEHALLKAETLDGREVTDALKAADGVRVSPEKLRAPQLRGFAEAHGFVLDFGPLDASQPLVLVMIGWLRFGGGMANIAASQDPALPFPFPTLEAEVAPGTWKAVDVVVGAPAGKTKTIIVDLHGKLDGGTRRLRLTEAFEIHWDRVALMEKKPDARTKITLVAATEADLHFRGFSPIKDSPVDWPLTPDYQRVSPNSYWTITPGGWCTRYGDVNELIAKPDEGLVLINAGDELTLKFAAGALPPKPSGTVREFFLYVDGWDKDADFHVAAGTQVEPLPYHGMNDQFYGREKRPAFPSDALHRRYNTRWVEGRVLKREMVKRN